MCRPTDKKLDKVKGKLSIRQARLKRPEQRYHNKRIGNLKKIKDILDNKKEMKDLRKALGVRRAERMVESD